MKKRQLFGAVVRLVLALALVFSRSPSARAAAADPAAEDVLLLAGEMVQSAGRGGGLSAVLGRTDCDLALALARTGNFVVQGLYADPGQRDAARAAIRGQGLYGTVSAQQSEAGHLPFVDDLLTLVVADRWPQLQASGLSLAEIARVLAPLGTVYLGAASGDQNPGAADGLEELASIRDSAGRSWRRLRKTWPADIDQWTHFLHGADGNPVAQDLRVGPPEHYQWVAGPLWQRSHETDSSISSLVSADGRLLYIVDEAPISLTGNHPLPDNWCLAARDAFNGVLLWKVPIRRWGWREWKDTWFTNRPGDFPLNLQKRLVAVGDRVYVTLGYQAPVSQLDANSGQILQTYAQTERTNEILWVDGTLILSQLEADGVRLLAVDATSGETRWRSEQTFRGSTVDYLKWTGREGGVEPARLDPSLNTATDGRSIGLIDGPDIVCLDFGTGREKWRAAFPSDEADRTAGGIDARGDLWIGTMIVQDGVVLHASPHKLAGFAADSGQLLWSQPKRYLGHLWYEWKDVFVIEGLVWTWSDQLEQASIGAGQRGQRAVWPRTVNGYDLHTGRLEREVPLGPIFCANHHHRCYRNKATLRYILASRRGTEYVDLQEGQHTVHNWVRGTCHLGMMPANGLQYAPPHPCACYLDEKLNGLNALAPARGEPGPVIEPQRRLTMGPAFAEVQKLAVEAPMAEDWPTFRADCTRSGAVATVIRPDARIRWNVRAGRKVSAPTAVGDRVFAALVDEHQVVCLSAESGRTLWQFTAGARIDSPPTYSGGTLLFGSADGGVYCLRAEDGGLVWRFQAAPTSRWIGAFGQLESAWPVHGSVLVQDGTAYFAAGRSSQLDGGLVLYGLDARTGGVRCQTRLEGPAYGVGDFEQNFGLPMGSLPDVLRSDGQQLYMRNMAFDSQLQRQRGAADLRTSSSLLEDSYFKRMPWTYDGQYARLIAHDKQSVYYVRMFDSLRGLDPSVFFTPGRNGYLLFSKQPGRRDNDWTQRVPVRIRAMAVAGGSLFVAGPPDVVDPRDPLGSFEGRLGGLLYIIDAASGQHLAEHELPSPPVFNGLAAARGRLFVSTEDGSLIGLGP